MMSLFMISNIQNLIDYLRYLLMRIDSFNMLKCRAMRIVII